ncbi:MAG: hypothetical protein HY331_12115 [Chloroflexi bacterium]|nr:hypothetical protein [Chloroflexota bacterium]
MARLGGFRRSPPGRAGRRLRWPIALGGGGALFALAVGFGLLPWLRHLRQLDRGLPVAIGATDITVLSWTVTLLFGLALAAAVRWR